ncbi:MAG: hypothetical protein BGP25_02675 [Lysobacterales bacterium 63-13]|nr:MAG: hypothetical protein BGP25_02675 [Xanthomonadales bacterium 63-13]
MMNTTSDGQPGDVAISLLAACLLILCFVTGGDSATANAGGTAAQLLALPLIVLALFQCFGRDRFQPAVVRWGVVAAAAILVLSLIQLAPLPDMLWSLPAERTALLQDLEAVGVTTVDQRWTLSPSATERSLLFLLPGLALFLCMLALGRDGWRRMLCLVVALCLANLVFAVVQMAAGKDSSLNLYPDFVPGLSGIFANRNHQADFLAIGLVLVAVFFLHAWRRMREGTGSGVAVGALLFVALIFTAILPLLGSRAGVIVAMLMLVAVLPASGLLSMRSLRESRWLQVGALLAVLVFAIGLRASLAWMTSDAGDLANEGSRFRISVETLGIGSEHAPLGSGIGTFVAAFQQGASEDFLMNAYVNNAHNEYAQWWLEGGVLGVIVMLLALAVLARALFGLLRMRPGSTARVCGIAAMMGIGVIVLHSTVDYPLRTQALMAVFSVLCGIAVGAAGTAAAARAQPARRA